MKYCFAIIILCTLFSFNFICSPFQKEQVTFSLITPGTFHSDEVDTTYPNKNWLALIEENGKFSLEEIKVKFNRINAPSSNMGLPYSPWKVSINPKLNCKALISGPLNSGVIKSSENYTPQPLPSSAIYLDSNKLLLTVEGNFQDGSKSPFSITDYKLIINNGTISQRLVEHKNFDDNYVEILWIGDLDQDGISDLIINESRHYNVNSISLFLSSQAKKDEVLHRVSNFRTVGC